MITLMAASAALEKRGLVLVAAATEQHGLDHRPASCTYLRPIGTQALSIDELWAIGEELVHCRCGACFDCLRMAGCIDCQWLPTQ